jgi:hypothetical protein
LDIQKPIQIKPHKIGSDWIGFFLFSHPKPNQTASNINFGSDGFLPQNRSKPNREHPYSQQQIQYKYKRVNKNNVAKVIIQP